MSSPLSVGSTDKEVKWILKTWFKSTNCVRAVVEMYQEHISFLSPAGERKGKHDLSEMNNKQVFQVQPMKPKDKKKQEKH